MQTTDLDLARALLFANKDATLVAVRGDEIITVTDRGVKPLLRWVLDHKNLKGFSVADKVVGKAPANRANDGQCPMDASVTNVWEPYEAVGVLEDRACQMGLLV